MSFQPLTNFVYVTERSRQKHEKNVWEWFHFLGVGMDFQVKEWSFWFRNGLHACLYNNKIVISMLNCYCREHLNFFMLFVALTSRLVLNTLLSLYVAVQAYHLSSGRFFL